MQACTRGLLAGVPVVPFSTYSTSTKLKARCPRLTITTRASDEERDLPNEPPSSIVPDTLPLAGVDTDWRAFRARLVASTGPEGGASSATEAEPWAHPLTKPEEGCLLLASPMYFTQSQTYFHQSVILIMAHDNAQGSYGVILNKPTEHRIAAINQESALPSELNSCTLYMGGEVHTDAVSIVHGVRGPHTREVLPGVFIGGIEGLTTALNAGETNLQEIKVVLGLAGWGAGQLEDEVAQGAWIVAAASRHLVLSPSVVGSGEEMWHATLQIMGGDYAGLSAAMKETFRADIMGLRGRLESTQDFEEENEAGSGTENDSEIRPRGKEPGQNNGSGI